MRLLPLTCGRLMLGSDTGRLVDAAGTAALDPKATFSTLLLERKEDLNKRGLRSRTWLMHRP